VLSFVIASLMVVTSFVVIGVATIRAGSDASADVGYGTDVLPGYDIDPVVLEKLIAGSTGSFDVYVVVGDRGPANSLLASKGLPEIAGKEFPGLPTIRLMELDRATVEALANTDGVMAILPYERPMVDSWNKADAAREDFAMTPMPLPEDIDVDDVHGAVDAWLSGYTGDGVKIAIIDDGFDLAHPDLQGQQARYEGGDYDGWPMAYDDYGAYQWSNEEIGGWIADTSTTIWAKNKPWILFDGTKYNVKGLADIDGNTVRSKSGYYHVGYHPDWTLELLWGGPVAVLVVDTVTAGVYDTVYVDVMRDFDFANDKPCTKGDEISYFDAYDAIEDVTDLSAWNAGDGYADYSGGMVSWISDGIHVYPASDWLLGADFVADAGNAVAFIGAFAGTHGTMTSSAALANGYTAGGQLEGMAPDAKLIAIPFTGSTLNAWLFAQYGVDGELGTGDEADIVSNSYGWSDTAIDAGYQILDMAAMTVSLSGPTLWFWSTGNGGPGYGTVHSVYDPTSVHVGAGTTMQYRYVLGYEPYGGLQKWGDVVPFSNSGPGRNGKLNAEVIASGAYSLEPAPLNWDPTLEVMVEDPIGNGYMHRQIGSGTSHATPTAAGGAALGYQAYMAVTGGMVPDKDYAKAALMAAADDMHFDAFKQGAGWLNAGNYVDLMSGSAGVMTTTEGPEFTHAALYPGDVRGTAYEMFPNFVLPDEEYENELTTVNFGEEDVTVNVAPLILKNIDSVTKSFVTKMRSDIFVDIQEYVPEDTDLLRVTMYMPYDQTDPNEDYVQDVEYWLELHDWVDVDGNGRMSTSTMKWELFRYTVDGSQCNANQVMIKDPIERTTDGLIARIRAIAPMMGTEISLQIDSYQLQEFEWAKVRECGSESWSSSMDLDVPAGGEKNWEIQIVPEGAYVGSYAAAVYVDDGSRVQCIPIVLHVPATDYEFEFGGESNFETPYNNDVTGVTDKWWRFEVGDWRMFWVLPDELPDENAYLLVCSEWEEEGTDINLHVLAPALPTEEELPWSAVFDEPYGPGYLEKAIASSDERYMGAGIFGAYANAGPTKEAIAAPLGEYENALESAAPFAIVTRCPLISGSTATVTLEGYTKMIVMNGYEPVSVELEIDLSEEDPSGSIDAWMDIEVEEDIEASGSGDLVTVGNVWDYEEIYQDQIGADFYADLANAVYTKPIDVVGSSVLKVTVWEAEDGLCPDIDLGLWYDADLDGVAELNEPYWYVGAGGSDESLSLRDPADGTYLVKVLGYTVTGNPGHFGLSVQIGIAGSTIEAVGIDGNLGTGVHGFTIEYSVPSVAAMYVGAATFGFLGASDMFRIEVVITVVE